MTILAAKSLALALGTVLFRDLSFTVNAGDRIGLIAANGLGKSSLLRCLAGLSDATSGDVTRARSLTVGLVDPDVPPALLPQTLRAAVLQALPEGQAEAESWRADIMLDNQAVPEDFRETLRSDLSGGWQRTALLARVAITAPDIYLLDEPTNHLDIEGQEALEAELLTTGATCLLVSHDRSFVRAVGNRFWQIAGKKLIEAADPEAFFASQMTG